MENPKRIDDSNLIEFVSNREIKEKDKEWFLGTVKGLGIREIKEVSRVE